MLTSEQFKHVINKVHRQDLNQRELLYYLAHNRMSLSIFQVNELMALYENDPSFVKNCVRKGVFKPTQEERSFFGRIGNKLPKVKISESLPF